MHEENVKNMNNTKSGNAVLNFSMILFRNKSKTDRKRKEKISGRKRCYMVK